MEAHFGDPPGWYRWRTNTTVHINHQVPPPPPCVFHPKITHSHQRGKFCEAKKKKRVHALSRPRSTTSGSLMTFAVAHFWGPTVPNPEPYDSLFARHNRPNPICFPTRQALPGHFLEIRCARLQSPQKGSATCHRLQRIRR